MSKSKIAVLGLTFKKDCDDLRDSLSTKLVKILKNEFVDFETTNANDGYGLARGLYLFWKASKST